MAYDDEPLDFEPFGCPSLPIPCEPVEVSLRTCFDLDCPAGQAYEIDTLVMSPEQIETAEFNARCVAEGLRDASQGTYEVRLQRDQGIDSADVQYTVFEDGGVVASVHHRWDLAAGLFEAYRQLRAPDYFDACLGTGELIGTVACIGGDFEQDPTIFGIDAEACIDAEPSCPG